MTKSDPQKSPDFKRITANLPADLLEMAQAITGMGITETLVEGLTLITQREAASLAESLRGKILLEKKEGKREGRS